MSSLQQVVEQSANQYAKAFQSRDVKALAELFTPEAEMVDGSGIIFHGRAAIAAEFAASFQVMPEGTMTITLISIRPIAEGVLVEDGISSFALKSGGPMSLTRYTATHVKQSDGKWLIASVRELEAGAMTAQDRLQALSWLIGGWHEDIEGSTVATDWSWSDNESYLIGDFTVQLTPEVSAKGTHRIGWDEERKQFRSWIFEANGGYMEGWWRPNSDGSWSVSLSGINASGVRRSSTLTYVGDGEGAMVVSQTDCVVDGEAVPGHVHRVVRRPPDVARAKSQQ